MNDLLWKFVLDSNLNLQNSGKRGRRVKATGRDRFFNFLNLSGQRVGGRNSTGQSFRVSWSRWQTTGTSNRHDDLFLNLFGVFWKFYIYWIFEIFWISRSVYKTRHRIEGWRWRCPASWCDGSLWWVGSCVGVTCQAELFKFFAIFSTILLCRIFWSFLKYLTIFWIFWVFQFVVFFKYVGFIELFEFVEVIFEVTLLRG